MGFKASYLPSQVALPASLHLLGAMLIVLLMALLMLRPSSSMAEVTVQIGPAATGNGGPNPLSVPPTNLLDYEIVWLHKDNREWAFSIFPGVLYGKRFPVTPSTYLSVGGGLVINTRGMGPGLYSAFGYQACSSVCFNAEYKQALGITTTLILNPYAIRLGITFFPNSKS